MCLKSKKQVRKDSQEFNSSNNRAGCPAKEVVSSIKSIAPAVQGRLSTPQNSAASLLVKKSHIHPRREKQVATQPTNLQTLGLYYSLLYTDYTVRLRP